MQTRQRYRNEMPRERGREKQIMQRKRWIKTVFKA